MGFAVGWGSVVGIAIRYGLDGPGSNPGGGRGEIFGTRLSRSLLYNGYRVFPGAWLSPPTSCIAEVKETV
jgi:hypothetical protein